MMLSSILHQLSADELKGLIGEFNYLTISVGADALESSQSAEVVRKWLTQVLAKLEDSVGPNDARVISVLFRLARLSFIMSDYDNTEKECQKILQRRFLRANHAPDDVDMEYIYHHSIRMLAWVQWAQGVYDRAIITLKRGLATAEKVGDGISMCSLISDLEQLSGEIGDKIEAN